MKTMNKQELIIEIKKLTDKYQQEVQKKWWFNTQGTWKNCGKEFNTENLKLEHKSPASSYWSGNDEKGQFIIRFSNHWGSDIRTCDWYLSNFKKQTSWKWEKGFMFGKIYVENLKFNSLIVLKEVKKEEINYVRTLKIKELGAFNKLWNDKNLSAEGFWEYRNIRNQK